MEYLFLRGFLIFFYSDSVFFFNFHNFILLLSKKFTQIFSHNKQNLKNSLFHFFLYFHLIMVQIKLLFQFLDYYIQYIRYSKIMKIILLNF